MNPGRRSTDGKTWVHPQARELVAETFADDVFYVEDPDVPAGMTLPEYRRARWQKLTEDS